MIDKVWEQGAKEGFSREEIAEIIRPIARQKGLNKNQVFYLTHKPELMDRSKQQYEALKSLNIQTLDYDIEHLREKEEYKNLAYEMFPDRNGRDHERLKEDVRQYGQFQPVIVNDEGYILHGYQTFRACKELGIKPRIELKSFLSEAEEMIFVCKLYLRGGLPEWQRCVLGVEYYEPALISLRIHKHLAKLVEVPPETIGTFLKDGQKGMEELDKYVAKLPEVSCETMLKGWTIINEGSEEMKRKLENEKDHQVATDMIDMMFNEIKEEKMRWISNV